jgi:hypothetical protein
MEGVVCARDRRAFVTTPPADPEELSIIAVAGDRPHELKHGEQDHWHTLATLLDSPAALPSVMLHLGGQVSMGRAFHASRLWLEERLRELASAHWAARGLGGSGVGFDGSGSRRLLRRKLQPNDVDLPAKEDGGAGSAGNTTEELDRAVERAEEVVRERLREEYRSAWNLPSKRYCMARCSSMMAVGASDLCPGYDELWLAHKEFGAEPPPETARMLRLAQEVCWEYQWQLADPTYEAQLRKGTNEFVQFRTVGYVGVMTLDCRGNRLRRNGERKHDASVMGPVQRKFVEAVSEWGWE